MHRKRNFLRMNKESQATLSRPSGIAKQYFSLPRGVHPCGAFYVIGNYEISYYIKKSVTVSVTLYPV